jgi:hypothetical protein
MCLRIFMAEMRCKVHRLNRIWRRSKYLCTPCTPPQATVSVSIAVIVAPDYCTPSLVVQKAVLRGLSWVNDEPRGIGRAVREVMTKLIMSSGQRLTSCSSSRPRSSTTRGVKMPSNSQHRDVFATWDAPSVSATDNVRLVSPLTAAITSSATLRSWRTTT